MAPDGMLRFPKQSTATNSYVLHGEIPALQLVATEKGRVRWGPLTRLPRGAQLSEFGNGFDDRTRLVRFGGFFYIIFQQDLAASVNPFKPK